ncbi:MAG: S8 family serine peptidase, partial [Firmicutes bacterium]|nr:S8 family serine peptidase [Bacillota bacterium]
MKKTHLPTRLLAMVLAFALLFGFAVPVGATGTGEAEITFRQVDNSAVSVDSKTELPVESPSQPDYADTDVVRVSIFLEKDSTVQAGYSTRDIAQNSAAMLYRAGLQVSQCAMTASIERATGEKLDVVWNMTLAANAISANVEYGQIAAIEKLPGVAEVVLETRYEPQETVTDATSKPNMVISTQMTGTNVAWQSGYTGAGMRVAIIDTGLDTDHQSVAPGALEAALRENAAEADVDYEEYLKGLDLLDAEEIARVLPQLNAAKQYAGLTAEDLYISLKAPFGFNYVDSTLDVTHDNDDASEHGSHVAGIAVANRLVEKDGAYVSAADAVGMVGNAPDAQIIVMKVFGQNGGAYDSDYMAALEDAILLGCDSVNMSLGS